jgi:hypothetical protein
MRCPLTEELIMNRDYFHRHRDASRYDEEGRRAGGRGHDHPSRYEDSGSHWNDEQTARWLSHYGGPSQRSERDYDADQRPDYDRAKYAQGYGSDRSRENPRYGQQFQESWGGYPSGDVWRQRGNEHVAPGMHGRYGWPGEGDDQGSLNFQSGEYGYGSVYGPTFGSTYRHPEHSYENDHGRDAHWHDQNRYRSNEPGGGGMYYGRGPSGYIRSDERIREDVCDRLTDDPHVDASAIDVAVESGIVTLQGQVSDRQMKHRAEDCAEHVSGVKDVENRLRVAREAWVQEAEGNTLGDASSSLRKG